MGRIALPILFFLCLVAGAICTTRYVVVVDGGSSGSKINIFSYDPSNPRDTFKRSSPMVTLAPGLSFFASPGATACITLTGTAGCVAGPNGTFADYLDAMAYYLVEQAFPVRSLFRLYATAGMRGVEAASALGIYSSVYDRFSSTYSIDDPISDVRTASGTDEALWGWITANLAFGADNTLGTLDLGGASTQITYESGGSNTSQTTSLQIEGETVRVYAQSYLGFGLDSVQLTYLTMLAERAANSSTPNITSPCYPSGTISVASAVAQGMFKPAAVSILTKTFAIDYIIGEADLDACVRDFAPVITSIAPYGTDADGNQLRPFFAYSARPPVASRSPDAYLAIGGYSSLVAPTGLPAGTVLPYASVVAALGSSCSASTWTSVAAGASGVRPFLARRCEDFALIRTLVEVGYAFPTANLTIDFLSLPTWAPGAAYQLVTSPRLIPGPSDSAYPFKVATAVLGVAVAIMAIALAVLIPMLLCPNAVASGRYSKLKTSMRLR